MPVSAQSWPALSSHRPSGVTTDGGVAVADGPLQTFDRTGVLPVLAAGLQLGHGAEPEVRVTVRDFGPGIPEEEREFVFRPFYRLDHARNQDEGNTGLGLAIARELMRVQGGDLTLATNNATGATFLLELPDRQAA